MKQLVLILILLFSMLSVDTFAKGSRRSQSDQTQTADFQRAGGDGDNPVPWPWGLELDFPWSSIEGTWRIAEDNIYTHFVLRVVKNRANIRQLEIIQVDPAQCEVIGSGAGVEFADKVVRGQLTDYTNKVYKLSLHVFSRSSIPAEAALPALTRGSSSKVILLEIFPTDRRGGFYHFLLEKVPTALAKECVIK